MVLYAVCLFLFAAAQLLAGVLTYLGKYEVVYDYYISGVNDLQGYTKQQGIATMCMSIPAIVCGVLFLVEPLLPCALIGIGVLVASIVGGFFLFKSIQQRYNGGMF